MLKEDLHLATPHPHPSEAPIININPLATTPQPARAGAKLSLLSLSTRTPTPLPWIPSRFRSESRLPAPIQEHPNEGRHSAELSSGGSSTPTNGSIKAPKSSAPPFGDGNPVLATPNGKSSSKRVKPKNSLSKSNSSFVSRYITSESLNKRLQEHNSSGLYAFANINRAFQVSIIAVLPV